jgi:hypothetical protein
MAKAIGGCDSDCVCGIKGVADPGKSPSSKALSYLRGELLRGNVFDRIENSSKVISENLKLVSLPFKNYSFKFDFQENQLSRKKFIKVFDRYKFLSFIKNIDRWERAFIK